MADILIVDDEQEIRDLIMDILKPAGHRLESAPNGRAALDRLKAARFDLLIHDGVITGSELF